MKTGKRQTGSIIYVIISKNYNIQALSRNKDYAIGFAELIGGVETCFIIQTLESKIDMDASQISNNMLYEWNNIWLSHNLDCALLEFIEMKQSELSEYMDRLMELLDYYKFTDEENVYVNRFIETYDYYFVRDVHGFTAYDANEEIDYRVLLKLYLNTVKRNI